MWRAFRDVADGAGPEWDASSIYPQAAAAFNDLADDVFVVMVDLFSI